MSIFRDRIEFSRGIRIQYQVREQATPSTSHGITAKALAKAFCGQKPTPTLPIIHFFQTDLSSKQLWFIDLIQASDCRARTSPNLPCVAKINEDRITIPSDDINATLGQYSPIVSKDLQGGFPMKNWCYFDAMTVRKRKDLRLLSDLLSPISEPWNDVFQTNKSP